MKLCPQREREAQLRSAIKETIDVIEERCQAFKSKKFEMPRNKLTQMLIDAN